MPFVDIQSAMRAELAADATLTGLVGPRIAWDKAGRNWTRPYVVLDRLDTETIHHQLGPSNLGAVIIEAICVAEDAGTRNAVCDAVRSVLDGFDGTMQGVPRVTITRTDRDDRTEAPPEGGSERDAIIGVATYEVWHQQET